MMDRRAFLRGLAAAVAAKLPLPVFPAPPSPASATDGLLRGELGVWEGVRIHRGNGDGPEGVMTLAMLDRCREVMEGHKVSPCWIDGEECYSMVIHPENDWYTALRGDE